MPILIDEADVIIAGHGRVLAAECFGISGKIAAAMADSSGEARKSGALVVYLQLSRATTGKGGGSDTEALHLSNDPNCP